MTIADFRLTVAARQGITDHQMWSEQTIQLIHAACDEDLADVGDITSGLLPEPQREVVAHIVPREVGVVCGLALGAPICDVFSEQLQLVSRGSSLTALRFEVTHRDAKPVEDGLTVTAGDVVAMLRGPEAAVLAVERTLLNFLGRMSGVATLTRKFVDAAKAANPRVEVLDTRKTLPGWRELDKYAVRCGGGVNHRFGLYDAILIKDNHIAGVPVERLAATLFEMLNRKPEEAKFVEVEVDNLDQLREVCKVVGVDIALLDNFSLDDMRQAVEIRDGAGLSGKLKLEASGGVSLERVAEIAATGVDRISVGALTHSAPSLDIGLDFAG